MHGFEGWKGWDNDPAFGAFLSDVHSLSLPNALEIAGSNDMVHEFAQADAGHWELTAWTYVPSDFDSGSTGPLAGSYFVAMNTYADGGPHEEADWSIQMNFDSNDGMLKVYYGNGMNTVDVPYLPDEWVEVRADIDLTQDWTRIYYDHILIAEYPWTGGALGGGGGASNIAAIDLYANGASPVYYDDLRLQVVSTTGDINCTGTIDLGDIEPFVLSLTDPDGYGLLYPDCPMSHSDLNLDGEINAKDIQAFADLLISG